MIRSIPTIGFFVSKLDYGYQRLIWKGLRETAREKGANLIAFPGAGINEREGYEYQGNIIYSLAGADCVDGILMLTNMIANNINQDELIKFCKSYAPLPVVSIGLNLPGIKSIITDNSSGMEELIKHLITCHGRKKIALITGPEGHQEADQRRNTFRDVCRSFDLATDDQYIVKGNFRKYSGEQAVSELIFDRKLSPDAIVASNDWMAFGAIESLVRLGIRVPEDIIVVGFDNIPESEYFTPPLTTVHQPVMEIGTIAVESMLRMIGGDNDSSLIVFPTHSVIRQSCGCLPEAVSRKPFEKLQGQLAIFPKSRPEWKQRIVDKYTASDKSLHGERPANISFMGQLEECLDAFHEDMSDENGDKFLPILNRILRESVLSGLDVNVWYNVIEAIRHATIESSLANHDIINAYTLWEKARSLIAETTVRLHEHRRMSTEQWMTRLKEIGNMLITTFDLEKLIAVIEYALKELKVSFAACALYGRDEPIPDTANLLFAFNGEMMTGRLSPGFKSSLLMPPDYDLFATQRIVIIEPLYFQEEQLGFLVCEANPDEPLIYDTLRQQISSALKGAFLVDQIKRHAETLEDEVANRTRELVTVNTMLEDEIRLRRKVEENLIESEKNLRAITEATPIPLVIVRPSDGRFHYANSPFLESFGISNAGSGGNKSGVVLSIFDFFNERDLRTIMEKLDSFPELSHIELAARKCDGTLFWVISSFRRMIFRQEDAILAGFYDLTERRRLEQEILEVSGNERRRIGQELHDDICQNMVGIAAIGQVIENQIRQSDPGNAKKAAYLNQLIHTTLIKTKALSEGLYPAGLERSGLFIMLQQLAKNVELQFNIVCTAKGNEADAEYDDIVSLNLYRIAQEAVQNAIRHGACDAIEIVLSMENDNTILTIADNGKGVPFDVERSAGLGIKSMRYRANVIGGKFEIKRNGKRGTIVSCSVRKKGKTNEQSGRTP